MAADKQRINLQLDAHRVTLMVDRDQEEFYRQAADLLKKRFDYYARTRAAASAELIWAYVALDVAVNLCSDAREKSVQPVAQALSVLNERLLSVLDESKPNDEKK